MSSRKESKSCKESGSEEKEQLAETSAGSIEAEQSFTSDDPSLIARQAKHSAESSANKQTTSYKSAMSALVLRINRTSNDLSPEKLKILEKAKDELRALFNRKK